ncbi:hypothetical protein [Halodesulfurarchaeum sp.]|uniref:hypothetical protein n=1 Tax=Halodesulfurarchaeum sp. TaxID=1980530 RepID=UPI002FC289FA
MNAETVRRQGTLEIKTFSKGREVKRLVECPFCCHTFDDHDPQWKHFLEEHDPENAGLTPLGDGGKSQSPLFEPMDEIPGEFPIQSNNDYRPVAARSD